MTVHVTFDEDRETQLASLRATGRSTTELVDLLIECAEQGSYDTKRRMDFCQEAYHQAVALRYPLGRLRSLTLQSQMLNLQARGDQALPLALEALTLLPQVSDPRLVAQVYALLAETYRLLGQYAEALQYNLEALKRYQHIGDPAQEAKLLNLIGMIHEHLGAYERAKAFMHQALEIYQRIGDRSNEALLLNNIAFQDVKLGDYAQAHATIEQCLRVCNELRQLTAHVRPYGYALDTLSEVLSRLNKLDEAEQSIIHALEENRLPDGTMRYGDLEIFCWYTMGRIQKLRRNWEVAEVAFTKALELSTKIGMKNNQLLALQEIVVVYEQQGDFTHALASLRKLAQLRREIFNEEQNRKVQNLRVCYEAELLQRERVLLQEQYQELEQSVRALQTAQAELHSALDALRRHTTEQERLLFEREQQQQLIRETSMPVLPLTDTILIMPLIGVLDHDRLHYLQEQALKTVQRTRSKYLLFDITGIARIDDHAATGLVRTIAAVRLLGTQVMVIGIAPKVAQAFVALGGDLQGIRTVVNLQLALQLLGIVPSDSRNARHF